VSGRSQLLDKWQRIINSLAPSFGKPTYLQTRASKLTSGLKHPSKLELGKGWGGQQLRKAWTPLHSLFSFGLIMISWFIDLTAHTQTQASMMSGWDTNTSPNKKDIYYSQFLRRKSEAFFILVTEEGNNSLTLETHWGLWKWVCQLVAKNACISQHMPEGK
jgi:hypothetical protein